MAIDPRDPNLARKIEEELSKLDDSKGDRPPQPERRSAQVYESDEDREERLAETRRRRDLGKEGRDLERMEGQASQTESQAFMPEQNRQMTEYERRSLRLLESIDRQLSQFGGIA